MTISTQLTQKDFVSFSLNANRAKAALLTLPAILGVFLLLTVAFHYATPITAALPFPYVELFMGLVLVGIPFLLLRGIIRSYRLNTSLHGPISYTFGPEGMEVEGQNFTYSFSWPEIYKVQETSRLVLVWQNPKAASIIPKRFFKDDELETFRKLWARAANAA